MLFLSRSLLKDLYQRKTKGVGELRGGGGETYHKTPRQKRLWTPPPTYDTIPPPLCSRPVILLRGNGHRPDESHFLRPPKEPAFSSHQAKLGDTQSRRKRTSDPRVGPRVAPRVGPQVDPRVRPRDRPRERPLQDPRGLISLFSALQ